MIFMPLVCLDSLFLLRMCKDESNAFGKIFPNYQESHQRCNYFPVTELNPKVAVLAVIAFVFVFPLVIIFNNFCLQRKFWM